MAGVSLRTTTAYWSYDVDKLVVMVRDVVDDDQLLPDVPLSVKIVFHVELAYPIKVV
jgi:hypothetical protein